MPKVLSPRLWSLISLGTSNRHLSSLKELPRAQQRGQLHSSLLWARRCSTSLPFPCAAHGLWLGSRLLQEQTSLLAPATHFERTSTIFSHFPLTLTLLCIPQHANLSPHFLISNAWPSKALKSPLMGGIPAYGKGWNLMIFKVPSHPNHSVILWVCKPSMSSKLGACNIYKKATAPEENSWEGDWKATSFTYIAQITLQTFALRELLSTKGVKSKFASSQPGKGFLVAFLFNPSCDSVLYELFATIPRSLPLRHLILFSCKRSRIPSQGRGACRKHATLQLLTQELDVPIRPWILGGFTCF